MNWIDEGFLISKNRYNENSLITEFFTKDRGKISGIIFGGTSKKIKNYLQIGNRLHINYNSKSDNRIGYFKVEILDAYSPLYFDHKQKLSCIISATNLVKILTADSQANIKVYKNIGDASQGLQWQLAKELLYSDYWGGQLNLYVSSSDIPAIVDVDNDGDIDVLTYHIGGERLQYHKNISIVFGLMFCWS